MTRITRDTYYQRALVPTRTDRRQHGWTGVRTSVGSFPSGSPGLFFLHLFNISHTHTRKEKKHLTLAGMQRQGCNVLDGGTTMIGGGDLRRTVTADLVLIGSKIVACSVHQTRLIARTLMCPTISQPSQELRRLLTSRSHSCSCCFFRVVFQVFGVE